MVKCKAAIAAKVPEIVRQKVFLLMDLVVVLLVQVYFVRIPCCLTLSDVQTVSSSSQVLAPP